MEAKLLRMAKVASANPAAFGVADATDISGFKCVKTESELYSIAPAILSVAYNGDKSCDGSDAIGQRWYVSSKAKYYELVDWENDGSTVTTTWKELADTSGDIEGIPDSDINKLFE